MPNGKEAWTVTGKLKARAPIADLNSQKQNNLNQEMLFVSHQHVSINMFKAVPP